MVYVNHDKQIYIIVDINWHQHKSYHPRHIKRQINYSALLFHITGVQYIRDVRLLGKLFAELVQRGERVILAGLYFNRGYVVSVADLAFGCQKVDFHSVFAVLTVRIGVEKQLMSAGGQHLRYDILNDHSHIDLELVEQELLVDLLADNAVLIKSVADQKPCVSHIHLKSRIIPIKL